MKMYLKIFLVLVFSLPTVIGNAYNSYPCVIYGRITNEKGEGISAVDIHCYVGDCPLGTTMSDLDGFYSIEVPTRTYCQLVFRCNHYITKIQNINILVDQENNIVLQYDDSRQTSIPYMYSTFPYYRSSVQSLINRSTK